MKTKSIGQTILFWVELILGARVLVFVLPVLLSTRFSLESYEDYFLLMIGSCAVLYFTVGLMSVLGSKLWKLFQYTAAVCVVLLTLAMINMVMANGLELKSAYFIPLILSSIFVIIITMLGSSKGDTNWDSILIIDDDQTQIAMVRPLLMKNGFSVLTATAGEEGLNIAINQKPDLILLDVIMPGMKGREVCASLKENSATCDIPVVFLTAKDSPDDIKAEMDAGALAHITKPVTEKTLISVIRTILNPHLK